MAESAGLGFLNLCLKLSGGSDEVSEIEYKRLVKELKPGTASEDSAVAILKALGPRGDPVLRRTGAGGAGGASGSPRSSVGPSSTAGSPASPGKLKATWGTASPESTPASPPKAAAAASPAGSPGKLKSTWGNAASPEASPASPPPAAASPASPGKLKATWGKDVPAEEASPPPRARPSAGVGAASMPALPRVSMEKAESSGSWEGPGMYLTYEPTQNGILFLVYSKTPVKDAFAYGKPGTPIPGFKFNTLSGKSELVKGASDKAVFMRGVAAFVKAVKQHSGSVDIKESAALFPFACYIHYDGGKVAKVVEGALTTTEKLDAAACVPQANADLKGISLLDKALFVQRGDSCGGTSS